MNYQAKYEKWLNDPYIDENTKEELRTIQNNEKEKEDRFYKDLEFGTAGLRGVIGNGSNRMNQYTVGKATQGLAEYIKLNHGENKGVAIAYDSRNMSKEFSEITALCLNANGIKSYVFESLRPVPELSFAVRQLGCIAGVMITASHNPPKYNGYKVYWEDGAQIVPPYDKGIIAEVNKIDSFAEIKMMDREEAIEKNLYHIIGKDIDSQYIETLKQLVMNPEVIQKVQKDMKIVYTPLHGTGNIPVQTILKEIGFENVYVVPEQEKPDGNFPTVDYPNPEDAKAFRLALDLAKKVNADLVLANDPDADRLGVYSYDTKTGEYQSFTGNMSGLLIAEYELSQKRKTGNIPSNGVLVESIVSSNLAGAIAREYGIELVQVLTGFKYIGEKMRQYEEQGNKEYLFGFEESYGCLIGTHARDKDGIAAVMALCEAAAFYKNQGMTLWDQMMNIFEKYGYYKESIISVTKEGASGAEEIKQMMENFRKNVPTKIGRYQVLKFRDYQLETIKDMKTGEETPSNLPKSNVLYFELENDCWCCIRPSGTEPKIKFYIGIKEDSMEKAEISLRELEEEVKKLS